VAPDQATDSWAMVTTPAAMFVTMYIRRTGEPPMPVEAMMTSPICS
jgi:hypothetical protein